MAISPNTDFSAGAILTASQQNQFPRGVMQLATATANSASIGAETATLTTPSFTAVANRYYRITYYEPRVPLTQNSNSTTVGIRLTNVSGTRYATGVGTNSTGSAAFEIPFHVVAVTTLAAGATTICGTLTFTGLNQVATRSATSPAFLLVEDIGPA
jgi:hypothetical protein